MKEKSPSILILGGGVAGMAAARSLKNQDLSVHLVEKDDHLGGKAALWACMATDTCKNCGACLSQEMARQMIDQNNLTTHLKTKIDTLKKTSKGIEALLTSGTTITADKVIMATGFDAFNPAQLTSLHWKDHKNIITTAQLNTLIREEGLNNLLENAQSPKIAFIQCVGSRNKKLKKDYCSQVCCKISMRQAQKLVHNIPDAQITLFYMDLQIIGKEIRQTLNLLSKQINLVQGIPAEILEDPDTHTLTLVTEDITTQSRSAGQFDLVVLSVGMESARDMNETTTLLEAVPNDWGFFNTKDAIVSKDLYIAGCAAGPKDILTSNQEGKIAGAKILEDLDLAEKPDINVAILGDGPQADIVTQAVAAKGYPVYIFSTTPAAKAFDMKPAQDNPPLSNIKLTRSKLTGSKLNRSKLPRSTLTGAKILAVDGTAGNFSIHYESRGKKENLTCGAVIAALEPCSTPNTGKGEFQTAMDLNTFSQISPGDLPEKSLILLDYFGPEFKSSARQALTVALAARKAKKEITILMNKMLVHGALGQRHYDQARTADILFLRFNTPEDIKIQPQARGFHITLKEATLPNFELALECDCLVLPQSINARGKFETIAKILRLPLDQEGFLQSANVRHRLIQSHRKGIFFTGTCHDEIDNHDLKTEIQEILSALATLDSPHQETKVTIDEKKCAKCLTCYRICPHSAIILNEKMRPQIMANACFSCQLCLSNCPAYAIESQGFTNDQIADQVTDQVVIFACERSCALAAENIVLPEKTQLITLPCACRISCDMILKSLINGASKIIISGCHEGNCRSMEGSTTARSTINAIAKMPGIKADIIRWEPVAANETHKFWRIISKA
ncbi:MAG: FAD-dependent oxidoreductase [Desulfobacteraceae bacterium]|nr:FAD-dependent oxidoreductase [Desulfobacteraceae bacterium]